MDALPEFELIRPTTLDEAIAARQAHQSSRLLAGGTDLLVNVRRGIVAPDCLIDVSGVRELAALTADKKGLAVGASVRIADLAGHAGVARHYPVLAQAASEVAGPSLRHMGTVGGNLCLDTRCIFYNQSEWWRASNDYCLKYRGEKCHVAPKSKVCFATFSGDLAPALLVLGAEIDIAGGKAPRGMRLADLYTGDGQNYLTLEPGEIVTFVRVGAAPDLRTGYEKMRVRRSIDFPLAGVAVALRREGKALAELRVAITGTNPRPVLLDGTAELCGGPLGEDTLAGLDDLVRDQIMAMKTTFTPGHYRRRVASVLARRLVSRLYEG